MEERWREERAVEMEESDGKEMEKRRREMEREMEGGERGVG